MDVIGIDLLQEMLQQAHTRAALAGVQLDLREGDIRDFELEELAALIHCPFRLGRVLRLRLEPRSREAFWVVPGGGLDEGESFEEAASRELREEVGQERLPLGRCIRSRTIEYTWGDWFVRQR